MIYPLYIFLFIVFVIILLILTQPHNDGLRFQITFLSLLDIFIIFPFSIRPTQSKLIAIIGYNGQSNKWFQIGYYVFILLSLTPFVLYILTNSPNNPIRPATPNNPYYLIPDTLRFGLIAITATLGGLVLTASNNSHLSDTTRRSFINVSKKFIISTILLIFFVVLFYTSNIYGEIDPTQLEKTITPQGVFVASVWWISVFCFYIGIMLFLLGIFELIISLNAIAHSNNPLICRTINHIKGYIASPQYEIRGNKIFRTPTHVEGFLPLAQYEIIGKKLYRTSTHIDGSYPYPQYEIRGKQIYRTLTHVDGYYPLSQYEIRDK
jgi:hypothetical protein